MPNELSRRAALGLTAALPALPLMAQTAGVQPFHVAIPQKKIDRILGRLRDTHFPDPLDAEDWRYGTNWQYMRGLVDYWLTKYDWRKSERRLNAFPQFTAKVEDFDIHFYHVKGKGTKTMPLILTHGWPGSVVEFLDAIGPLSDAGFDVVVPSLPGFGFSSKPKGKPIGPVTVARLWHQLMTGVLGYTRYGAQGGDWGGIITISMAVQHPEDLIGIHLNNATVRGVPEAEQSPEERDWRKAVADYANRETAYSSIQGTKPETVAFALTDNPLGTCAWITEKLKVWSDSGNDIESVFTKDQILANVMMYLVTDTAPTSVWIYRGSRDDTQGAPRRGRIDVPTAYMASPHEMTNLAPARPALERDFNLVRYTAMPRGGHFACFEHPQAFVADVTAFFHSISA